MLRIGVMPIPPARNTAGRVNSLWKVNEPRGLLTLSSVPLGVAFNAVLKFVSRMRMATIIGPFSCGELARENVRSLSPPWSPLRGFRKEKSACCPGRNSYFAPSGSNQKAIVLLAISLRPTNRILYSAMRAPSLEITWSVPLRTGTGITSIDPDFRRLFRRIPAFAPAFAMLRPKPMRQQVGESQEGFPVCGCLRQPVIETAINHEVPAYRAGKGPKVSHSIAAQERLREMPDFAGQCELSERMRNGKGLPELRPMHLGHDLLGEYSIDIDMKAVKIVAQKNRSRLAKSAKIQFGRGTGVKPARVADGNRGPRIVALIDDALQAREDFAHVHGHLVLRVADRERFALQDQLQARKNRQLRDLADSETPRKFR